MSIVLLILKLINFANSVSFGDFLTSCKFIFSVALTKLLTIVLRVKET